MRDAKSRPLGGGGVGWGGRGVAARPIAWADAGSLVQPDSGARSAAFSSVTPTPTLPLRGGGSSSQRARPICITHPGNRWAFLQHGGLSFSTEGFRPARWISCQVGFWPGWERHFGLSPSTYF